MQTVGKGGKGYGTRLFLVTICLGEKKLKGPQTEW